MIAAIVFSKDRPAQLDLLLRSIRANAPWVSPVTVIYRAEGSQMQRGYEMCLGDHLDFPGLRMLAEDDFRAQVLGLIGGGATMFLCDDDVMYRRKKHWEAAPDELLENKYDYELLCVSLRLGLNTTLCYSLREAQTLSYEASLSGEVIAWEWGGRATGDYAYPGSLDGHVFRGPQLRRLLEHSPVEWSCPNELEDALNRACQTSLLPMMAAYRESLVVGVPVNSVQTAYKPNRNSEAHHAPVGTLLRGFLNGRRLDLASVVAGEVNAAHCEFELKWLPEEKA